MSSETLEHLIDQAASRFGIAPGYWDIWGQYHHTTHAAKREILRAMGIAADDAASLGESLHGLARREWQRLMPPVFVVPEANVVELTLNVPAESFGETAAVHIRLEDGGTSAHTVHLHDLPHCAAIEMDGRTWLRKQASIPARLPLGYHEIEVHVGSRTGQARYIVTPHRAFTPQHLGRGGRSAGLALSLYGVRSARNWGAGDFTDLLALIDWVATDLEASFLSLNPLNAIHNRRPFNTSPYLPNCTFYQNFLYLDVEAIEDFARSRRAQALRVSSTVRREIEELRAAPTVEYERAAALKLRFLKLLFVQFLRDRRREPARAREFDEFCAREGALLERFATYCALDEQLHRRNPDMWVWNDWPEQYRDPASAATREFRKKHWRSVMFYQYLQWQIDLQLRRAQQRARERDLAIGLYHDLPLATDRFGSDLWAHRNFYVPNCRVGSPPDDFSPKGQDWGFPPPNAGHHREDGYRLFADSIRRNCRHGGALRIDHVMRLFRLYWIPDASDATGGAYVRESNEDLVRIVALESVRNRVAVIGEDLGTVEPEIRETLARFGILSYRLFYFEKRDSGEFRSIDEYPVQSLVSSTTHDLPTITGFWSGADIAARHAAGVLDDATFRQQSEARQVEKQRMLDVLFRQGLMPEYLPRHAGAYPELTGELHHAIAGFLARTPSQLMAINQEDLTKEPAQQNLPGTTWQYPNWSRKMRFTIEQLQSDPEARALTVMFRNWIVETGRRNQAEAAAY